MAFGLSVIMELCLLGPAVGHEPIRFILPEFVSYLACLGEERWCVWETVDISVHQSSDPYEHVEYNVWAQRVLVGIMLAQRRRTWPIITSALGQCVLSGKWYARSKTSPA